MPGGVQHRNEWRTWLSWLLGWAVVIGSSACSSDASPSFDVDGSVDGSTPIVPDHDAGAPSSDASVEGGSSNDAGGWPVFDAGPLGDAMRGAFVPDVATPDAGSPPRDAGSPPRDAGDAGTPDVRAPQHPLAVYLAGSGHGTVQSNVGGIVCGTTCAALFDQGTSVTLTATPDPGAVFAGWSAPECPGAGACAVTMSGPRSVVARFFRPVHLSDTDKSPDVTLSPDRLGMQQVTLGRQGVRSDVAVKPGSGIFYFEAARQVDAPFIELGVATASVPLDSNLGDTDQTFGVDTGGAITGGGNFVGAFDAASTSHFGFVVDYRPTHPIVYLAVIDSGAPRIAFRTELSKVTGPLFIFLGGLRQKVGIQSTINAGNDTTNFPFFYDPKSLMRAAGIAGADELVLGWGDSYAGVYDNAPALAVTADQSVPLGSVVTVSATASDKEEGDLTSRIAWADLATPLGARTSGVGGTFALVPNALGLHELMATVTDAAGKVTTASVRVNVTGTLPVWSPVRLQPDAMSGAGIELSSDGLSARFTAPAKLGIRANQGLLHGFQYFEIHREIPVMNMGGGLVIQYGNLNPYGPVDVPPSCSVNVLGGTWHSLMFHRNFPDGFAAEEYYGFAVDYRGASPVVYVIVRSQVVDTIPLTDVTVPIYPMLYGNPTTTPSGPAESINFGAKPFHYDAASVLRGANVDVTGFKSGWGGGS
jgi:hypothetical protein